MKLKRISIYLLTCLSLSLASCSNMSFDLPKGEQGIQGFQGERGERGNDGKNGLSAYELWKETLKNRTIEWAGGDGVADFFLYLKGRDGKNGLNGKDGINGKDGADGTIGTNGLSAYELWKQQVLQGLIYNPKNPRQLWAKDRTQEADFWRFLTDAKGQDGINGKDSKNGRDGRDGINGKNGKDGVNGSKGNVVSQLTSYGRKSLSHVTRAKTLYVIQRQERFGRSKKIALMTSSDTSVGVMVKTEKMVRTAREAQTEDLRLLVRKEKMSLSS